MRNINVLAFDLFGTVLDWCSGLAAEARRLARGLDPQPDWEAFAVAWSKGYASQIDKVEDWVKLEDLLRMVFYDIAPDFDLYNIPAHDRFELAGAWKRLNPWPDARAGLSRLHGSYKLATLSNANRSMQLALADHTKLPWDYLLSAEDARCYKPCPRVYLRALKELKANPEGVMMVAAHTFDLNAAKRLRFRTALIERPSEPGSSRAGLDHEADLIVPDIESLADALIAVE